MAPIGNERFTSVWYPTTISADVRSSTDLRRYQMRQAFLRTVLSVAAHLKAAWNSGMFESVPITRSFRISYWIT